jgi:hypothetical protein
MSPTAAGVPSIEVRARSEHSSDSRYRWPFYRLGGTARVSSFALPQPGGPPLVLAHELTGDCSGSPVTFARSIAVQVGDLR